MRANADKMTKRFIPLLTMLTPGGGNYVNEADSQDPDWKVSYHGRNYERLLEDKEEYDPGEVVLCVDGGGERGVGGAEGREVV